jgi:hypothetical protein
MDDPFAAGDLLRATMVVESGRAKARFAGGRVCSYRGCDTVLSTYNASKSCWLHQREPAGERRRAFMSNPDHGIDRTRGRRVREVTAA